MSKHTGSQVMDYPTQPVSTPASQTRNGWSNKKIAGVVALVSVALLVILAIIGAVSGGSTDSNTTAAQPVTNSAPQYSSDTAGFDANMQANGIYPVSVAEQVAQTMCVMMNKGDSIVTAIQSGMGLGFTDTQVGNILGAGVAVYCPQHISDVQAANTTFNGTN